MQVMDIIQTSPVAHAQAKDAVEWKTINGMHTATQFARAEVEIARKQLLAVADVSCLRRYGVKGSKATQWLMHRNIHLPMQTNTWTLSDLKTLVLRLGNSEYLIEDALGGNACAQLANDKPRVENVYPVPRADAAFIVSGSASLDLFAEVCALDLSEKALAVDAVIMTQIAGISATMIRMHFNDEPIYRIWCDGTYGAYLWKVLVGIATELGGGPVGLGLYQR
jgi:sarcosine oxidase, subunit gamma